MIDLSRFAEVLTLYKQDFVAVTWGKEKYKWEAVKHFQDNWDINADDFAEMLERALAKTYNLLASMNSYPKGDDRQQRQSRARGRAGYVHGPLRREPRLLGAHQRFKQRSNDLLEQTGQKGQSYQTENAITTYLWLRYPDRYYIYKYGEVRKTAQELGSDCVIKQGRYADNVRNHLALYDEINAELRKDEELRALLSASLTPDCYPDPEMRTLTIDFGFYISRYLHDHDKDDDKWWPDKSEYDPASPPTTGRSCSETLRCSPRAACRSCGACWTTVAPPRARSSP